MNVNKWIRQIHRWLTIAFTAAVMVNGIAVGRGQYKAWLGLIALVPLALLFLTGVYMFAAPYAAKWRRGRTGSPAPREAYAGRS